MQASHRRVMYYHADASPVGGYVTHPIEATVQTDASVSLSQAGGKVASRIEGFKLDHILECGAAYSQATGFKRQSDGPEEGNWATLVTTVVENVNVLEVVTADRIVSRLAVEHPADGYYPSVSFVGCQFQNLRIAGREVEAPIDLGLLSSSRIFMRPDADGLPREEAPPDVVVPEVTEFPDLPWPDVANFLRKATAQADRILNNPLAPEWLKARYGWMHSPDERARKGYVTCSLVEDVQGTDPNATFAHVVSVPGFGNIFLGELQVTPLSFHLTMLRIEMGCLADGDISFGTTRGNGMPMP